MNVTAVLRPLLGVGAMVLAGCTTISGHKLSQGKDGTVAVEDVKGLPILVKRPTKAVYIITKTTYAVTQQTIDANGVVGAVQNLPDQTEVSISDQPTLLGPTEIFTIDPKRPAFGTLDYGINMTDGVVTSLTGKIDDKTLGEITKTLKDILDKVLPTPGGVTKQSGGLVSRAIKSQQVSLAIFDLAAGTVEVKPL